MTRAGFDFDSDYGRRYDSVIRQVVPGYDDLFLMALAMLDGVVGDVARVLVVGAGSGSELVTFGSRRPGWRFTAVEPSKQMSEIADARARAEGLADRAQVHHGYVADLPAEPAFDAATMILVLHFLPDNGAKLALLTDIAARLKPGAPLLMVDAHGDPASAEWKTKMAAWMRYVRFKGLTAEQQEAYRRQVTEGVLYVPEARELELLRLSGFGEPVCFLRGFLFAGWLARREDSPGRAALPGTR